MTSAASLPHHALADWIGHSYDLETDIISCAYEGVHLLLNG